MNVNNARHENVPPPLDLSKILISCHKRNDRIPGKIGANYTP